MTCGVQDLPQVSAAGLVGSAENNRKTMMLSATSIMIIAITRRTMYVPTASLRVRAGSAGREPTDGPEAGGWHPPPGRRNGRAVYRVGRLLLDVQVRVAPGAVRGPDVDLAVAAARSDLRAGQALLATEAGRDDPRVGHGLLVEVLPHLALLGPVRLSLVVGQRELEAAVGGEELGDDGGGVRPVGAPAGERHLVLLLRVLNRRVVLALLDRVQLHRDAGLGERGLHRGRALVVVRRLVVVVRDRRHRLTRLLDQLLGVCGVTVVRDLGAEQAVPHAGRRVVRRQVRLDHAVREVTGERATGDGAQLSAVQSGHERLAVLEVRHLLGVDRDVAHVRVVLVDPAVSEARVVEDRGERGGRQVVPREGCLVLAGVGLQALVAGLLADAELHHDLVRVGRTVLVGLGAPARVAVEHQLLALGVLGDLVRAVRHDLVVVLLTRVLRLRHRRERRQGHGVVEVTGRLVQVEGDGLAVRRAGHGLVEGGRVVLRGLVRALVRRVALGVLGDVQEADRVRRPVGDHRLGERAGDAVLDVGAGDVGAVLPLDPVAEREGPGLRAVRRLAGVRREVRDDRVGLLAVLAQLERCERAGEVPAGERKVLTGVVALGVEVGELLVEREDREGATLLSLGRPATAATGARATAVVVATAARSQRESAGRGEGDEAKTGDGLAHVVSSWSRTGPVCPSVRFPASGTRSRRLAGKSNSCRTRRWTWYGSAGLSCVPPAGPAHRGPSRRAG